MSENWDFYPCRVEDEPASIMLNLGLAKEAPLEMLPVCSWLRVALKSPRPDGLSSSDEFDRLCEIGDALEAAVDEASTQIRYVGRCTCAGRRDFYAYAESGVAAEAVLSSVMAAFAEYEFDTGHREDPQWRLYREFLYPTDRSMQLINNRRVLEALESSGDPLTASRPIRHFVDFDANADLDAFRQALAIGGFEIVGGGVSEKTGRQSIVFERTESVDFLHINQLTIQLLDLANSHGGDYDGWETGVRRPVEDAGNDEIRTEGSTDET
jgi:regulator of RNase E activity RraB